MEEPSKCDILIKKRDLRTLCLAGVRKISKLYEKSAIKKEHCTNCVRIGQGAQLDEITPFIGPKMVLMGFLFLVKKDNNKQHPCKFC